MAFAGPIWGHGLSSLLCCCPAIAQIKRGKRGGAWLWLASRTFRSVERQARGLFRTLGDWKRVHRVAAERHAPGREPDDGKAHSEGERDLREGSESAADRHQGVARANQQDVAALAERGGQSDAEVWVAGGTVASREQADRLASGCLCASAHRGHGPEPSAADHDGASLGEASTERLRDRDQRGIRFGRGGHTDVDAHSPPRFPARLRAPRTAEPPSDDVLAGAASRREDPSASPRAAFPPRRALEVAEASAPAGVAGAGPPRGASGVEAAKPSRGAPAAAAGAPRGGGGGAAVARSIRSWSRRRMAPALSRGWLPLPHLGDWTQEGQPVSHGQDLMVSLVARRCSAVSS